MLSDVAKGRRLLEMARSAAVTARRSFEVRVESVASAGGSVRAEELRAVSAESVHCRSFEVEVKGLVGHRRLGWSSSRLVLRCLLALWGGSELTVRK